MKTTAGLALALLLALAPVPAARAAAGKIAVVAAENFYGDIARQIGGAGSRNRSKREEKGEGEPCGGLHDGKACILRANSAYPAGSTVSYTHLTLPTNREV